jgi:hypothetical protein
MVSERHASIFREEYNGSYENLDHVFSKLKKEGASAFDCVKLLVAELKLPLATADKIVINSPAWSDQKDRINEFREEFYKYVTKK